MSLKKAGKPRFSCLLSFFWAFSGLFLIFVPFYSKKQGSRRDKKGTSFWKCPRNAQMVSPTLQISPGFFSLRGTKFPKPPENAQPQHTSLSVAAARSSRATTNLPTAAHKLVSRCRQIVAGSHKPSGRGTQACQSLPPGRRGQPQTIRPRHTSLQTISL